MSILDDLKRRDLIEEVDADPATAAQWLDDAGRHLEAATKIADLDPSGAYVLAYDAARKSVAVALLIAGHRVSAAQGVTTLSPGMPTPWPLKRVNMPRSDSID